MFGKTRHIHIVGIGGAGLSGIAEILLNLEFKISGSDFRPTEITNHLMKIGIFYGIILIINHQMNIKYQKKNLKLYINHLF